jgi:predicted MFS family arabinose efflux permease
VVAALGLQFFSASGLPLILGSIADRIGLQASQVGLLGTLELAAIAVASTGIAPIAARGSRVLLAIVGCVVTAAGQLLAVPATTFALLAVSRVVAGLGMGVAAGAAQTAVAASPQPDRLFSMYFAASTALGALFLVILPQLIVMHGYPAGYASLGIIALAAIPLVAWLPRPPLADSAMSGLPRDIPRPAITFPALIALALVAASDYGTWTFIERIGAHAGLTPEGIGQSLAAATLAGSAAAALMAWVGTRFGRIIPVVASFSVMVFVAFVLTTSSSPQTFVPLVLIWCASLFVAYSYVMGGLAAADSSGRLSAMAAGARSIGAAAGPSAAGLVVASAGYRYAGFMVGGWCAAGFLLYIPLTAYLSRRGSGRNHVNSSRLPTNGIDASQVAPKS